MSMAGRAVTQPWRGWCLSAESANVTENTRLPRAWGSAVPGSFRLNPPRPRKVLPVSSLEIESHNDITQTTSETKLILLIRDSHWSSGPPGLVTVKTRHQQSQNHPNDASTSRHFGIGAWIVRLGCQRTVGVEGS